LTLYVVLYLALLLAYVTVLKYMAEKPEEVLAAEAEERAQQPAGVATSAAVGPAST
jgi:cytochrome d ubiquinol oxidase subunit I